MTDNNEMYGEGFNSPSRESDAFDLVKNKPKNTPQQNADKLTIRRGHEKFYIMCRNRAKPNCKDLFESEKAMNYHFQTFHAIKPERNTFECCFCKKPYAKRDSLETHMALHTGCSRFSCPYPACPRFFHREHSLKNHINALHTWRKVYKCTECSMKFFYRQIWTHHLTNLHGKGNANAPPKQHNACKRSAKATAIQPGTAGKSSDSEKPKIVGGDSNEKGTDLTSDDDSDSPDVYFGSHELVKHEPAIDIDFDATEELNIDSCEDDVEVTAINLET